MTAPVATPPARPARLRRAVWSSGPALRFLSRLPGLILGVVVWEISSAVVDSPFFPSLARIMERFVDDWLSSDWQQLFLSEIFLDNGLPTLGRLAAGWMVGAVLGVAIGAVIASGPRLGAALEPLVRLGMSVPAPALLPIAIALFGFENTGKIFFIAFGAVWPVIINTMIGMRNADPMTLNSGRSLVLSSWTWFFRIRLPLASPQIMSGLRVSVNAAVLLIIVAELYATTSGIGFVIVNTQRNFDFVGTWSGIVLLALVGIICNTLFTVTDRRIMRWHHGEREATT